MELEAAASGAGHLDEQIGRVGGHGVPHQRRLCDVDGAVHHLEAAKPWHGYVVILGDDAVVGEAVENRSRRWRVEQCPCRGGVEQCRCAAPHPVEQVDRRTRLRSGVGTGGVAAAEAYGDRQVGVDRCDRSHRKRVEDAAVGEQAAVEQVGLDQSRYGDRGTNGVVDRPALQPDRLARNQIRRHGGVGNGEVLDHDLTEDLADRVEDLLGAQHPSRRERRIEQPQHRALGQRTRPRGVLVELACGLQTADQCTHRRTGNADDLMAAVAQFVDDADVCVATGAAATE